MNKESFDAIVEQQKREIKNLKAVQKAERKRAIKIISKYQKQLIKNSASYKILEKIKQETYKSKK